MQYSHFYTVDQWELRDTERYWSDPGLKEMFHTPCGCPVYKARNGIRWVCTGCYAEPPEEIMDVIWLGNPYKGWDDPQPVGGAGFRGLKFPASINSFYMSSSSSGSSTNFYCGSNITVSGIGTFSTGGSI